MVSSTGHLIIANQFISLSPEKFANAFNVIIQLGAILSVLVLYFDELNPLEEKTKNGEKLSLQYRWEHRDLKTMRLLAKIIIGFLPAAVLGFLFDDLIDEYLFNKVTVAIALIFYGIVIIVLEIYNKDKEFKYHDIDQINIKTILLIGLFQCLAMVPGTSRSAATIIGAMLLGCDRKTAAEFSFFLAIPTMLGATGLKIIKMGFAFTLEEWLLILVGSVVSYIVAYAVITKFMKFIKKNDFKVFGVFILYK